MTTEFTVKVVETIRETCDVKGYLAWSHLCDRETWDSWKYSENAWGLVKPERYDVGDAWVRILSHQGGGIRRRVFHYLGGAVAVPERKGLKAWLTRYPHTEEGAWAMVQAYIATYDRFGDTTALRTRPYATQNWTKVIHHYTQVKRVRCYWVGCERVLMSGDGVSWSPKWVETRTLSPVRTDKTPLAVGTEWDGGVERPIAEAYNDDYHIKTTRCVFLRKDGTTHDTIEFGEPWKSRDIYRAVLDSWWESECRDSRGWLVGGGTHGTIRGTRNEEMTGTLGRWSPSVLATVPPRIPDDAVGREFKEQLAMACFHTERLDRMITAYGEDWMERV